MQKRGGRKKGEDMKEEGGRREQGGRRQKKGKALDEERGFVFRLFM
jgi:hypothetical protein